MMRLPSVYLLCGMIFSACGGLGGEPEIVATYAPQQSVSEAQYTTNWKPNLAKGALIFAENCIECHGDSGDGKGKLVSAGSVTAPPDMTDLALTAAKSPLAFYEIISDGKIENLMPPWRNALNEQERWDVALYTYTLAYDDALLSVGERIWEEQCVGCELPNLIPPVFSDIDYGIDLNRGRFASSLNPEALEAAVAYARMRSLETGEVAVEYDAGQAVALGRFTGRVQHGSEGGTVPEGALVQLQYGNPEIGFTYAETTAAADSSFAFENVPLTDEFIYVVGAVYKGRVFTRRVVAGNPANSAYDQTITVYDVSNDPFVISIARIDIFLNPVNLEQQGSGLHVTQSVTYRNSSDRIFTSGRGFDDGREASLLLQFPADARILSDDDSGRYVIIEDVERVPDSLIDTLPVPPGDTHDITVEYFLPYGDKLQFEQAFNNLVDAELTIMLPAGMDLSGNNLALAPDQGTDNLKVYSGKLKLERDPQLSFAIAGDPYPTSSDDGRVITSDSLLPALLAIAAAVVAALGGITLWRRRGPDPDQRIDDLARQIAQLDDEHDRGQINHDVYHHRRRDLKAQLAQLMERQRDDG